MRRDEPPHRPRQARAWLRHSPLAVALALAALLRLPGLGGEVLYGDEAEYAVVARSLAQDWLALDYPPLMGMEHRPFVSQPPLMLYLMALSMKLAGASALAVTLPAALAGVATVAVVYALGARLGGRLAGAVAAFLLAVLPFHVELSRSAMLDAGFTLFVALTTLHLVAWWQERRPRPAALAGVAAALAALAKLPGVLACAAVAVVFGVALALAIASRSTGRPRGGAAVVGHAALAALPGCVGALAYLALLARIDALDALFAKLAWQARRVEGHGGADPLMVSRDAWYYLTDPAASFPALYGWSPLLLAGAGLLSAVLAWRRRPDMTPVLVMVGVLGAFFFLSDRKEGFYLLPFAPFVAILGGLASGVAWRARRRALAAASPSRPLTTALLVLTLLAPYTSAADTYARIGPGRDPTIPGFGEGIGEAAALARGGGAYGTTLGRFSLAWYAGGVPYHWYVEEAQLDEAAREGRLRFIVYDEYLDLPHERRVVERLVDRHGGRLVAQFPAHAQKVRVYELQPATTPAPAPDPTLPPLPPDEDPARPGPDVPHETPVNVPDDAEPQGRAEATAPPEDPAAPVENDREPESTLEDARQADGPKHDETPRRPEEPANKKEAPAAPDGARAAPEETPATKEETPAAPEETPAKKDEAPAKKDEAPAKKDEAPAKKDETPAKKDEKPAKGGGAKPLGVRRR